MMLLFITLLLLVIFLGSILLNQPSKPLNPFNPYISKRPLTQTEITFYHRLVEALPDLVVLAQVQLSSIIKVDLPRRHNRYYKFFNPISQQSVDFLICTRDFEIIAAVELDDRSHLRAEAIIRDNKKNKNLAAANLPLIRWHAEKMPEVNDIKKEFQMIHEESNSQIAKQNEEISSDQDKYFDNARKSTNSPPIFVMIAIVSFGFILWGMASTVFRPIKPSMAINQEHRSVRDNKLFDYKDIMQKRQLKNHTNTSDHQGVVNAEPLDKQENSNLQNDKAPLKLNRIDYDRTKRVECVTINEEIVCGNV